MIPFIHPELKNGEVLFMNVTEAEFKQFQKTKPKWVKKLRLGNVAYSTTGELVPEFKPMFAELNPIKGKKINNKGVEMPYKTTKQ